MKKILILTHEFLPFNGGIGTYVREFSTAAQKIGYQITVLAPDYGECHRYTDRCNFSFKVVRFKGGIFSAKYFLPMLIRSFYHTYFGNFDVIHVADWPHLIALSFINKFKKINFHATIYGSEIYTLDSTKYVRFLKIKNIFNIPSTILSISDFSKQLLLKSYSNMKEDKIVVTSLGVSPYWFQAISENNIREQYNISNDKKIILTVARLDERKGHNNIIAAIKLLPNEIRNNLTYIIVGSGSNKIFIDQLKVDALNCDYDIIFAGFVDDNNLRKLYDVASIFCLPGKFNKNKVEGFGLVFIEAAAQGLPSIGGSLGGMSEAIKNNISGKIIPSDSIDEITFAINELLTNKVLYNLMVKKSVEWAKMFTWERCVRRSYDFNRSNL